MAHDSLRAALASMVKSQDQVSRILAGICVSTMRMYNFSTAISIEEFLVCGNFKFSPRMLSRFYFPAGFSRGSWRRVFFSAGSQRVQISRQDSCRETRREFFPGRILPGKWATSAGSWRDPSERRESWWDPGKIPVPILQG